MKIRIGEALQAIVVALFFWAAHHFTPMMPERMAVHWGMNGNVNGWMPRNIAMYIMPFISVFMAVVFFVMARIRIKGKGVEQFRCMFECFCTITLLFMLYVYGLIIAWGLGMHYDVGVMLCPGFAVLMLGSGLLMRSSKPNYLVGIRTKATLENAETWDRTHRSGARLFYAGAIVTLCGVFFPKLAMLFIILPLIIIPIIVTVQAGSAANKT